MIDALSAWARGLASGDILSSSQVLLLLGVSTLLVVIVTGVLGVAAVALRARRTRRAQALGREFREWQGVLHSVLYDGVDPESLSGMVAPARRLDFLDFLQQYVRRLGGAERERLCQLAEPHLPLLLPLVKHRREGTRLLAVQTLGELGLPRYTTQVVQALDDPSPLVAMVAASTLAQAETPEYAGAVLNHLGRFDHWRRDFLAPMLASMGMGAAPALRRVLSDTGLSARVRAVAADALAALSDPAAAEPGQAALTSSDDVELRAATLRLLARVGREEHLDAVRDSLASPELPVRLSAIRAIGQFGGREDVPMLEQAAREDPSPWIALAAARALRSAGQPEALEALAGSEHPRAALGLQVMSEARAL